MEDLEPRSYLIRRMRETGIRPSSGNIRDISSAARSAESKAQICLYDKPMISAITDGTQEQVESVIVDARTANAQNRSGETLLMKACRAVSSEPDKEKQWLVETMLSKNADPMVQCQSKKNLLHDLIWTAKPPPIKALQRMQEVVLIIHRFIGTQRLLELFTAPDHHGHQPLDFLQSSQFETWQKTLDIMLNEPGGSTAGSSASGPGPSNKNTEAPVEAPVEAPATPFMMCLNCTQEEILSRLDAKGAALLQHLEHTSTSFLLADYHDPDYKIIATTSAFMKLTQFKPDEVLGQNCRFLQGPRTQVMEVNKIREALRTGGATFANMTNYRKDGSEFRNSLAFMPLHSNQGDPLYFIGIQKCPASVFTMMYESCEFSCQQSVSSRGGHSAATSGDTGDSSRPAKRLRADAEQSDLAPPVRHSFDPIEQMQVLKSHMSAAEVLAGLHETGVALLQHLGELGVPFLLSDFKDPDAQIVATTAAFCKLTQYSADEVLGQNCRFLQGPLTNNAEVDKIREALKTGGSTIVSLLNYRKDGSSFVNNFALLPLQDKGGVLAYFIGIQNCPKTLFAFAQTMRSMMT